jgi:hypothetical protein
MRSPKSAGVCAALATSVAACIVAAAPAVGAIGTPDLPGNLKNPLTTNVPILAWNGGEVKLVDCSPFIGQRGQNVEFRVQKFSGGNNPADMSSVQKIAGSETMFPATGITGLAGQGCAKANFDSIEPGLAIIHMTVTQNSLQGGVLSRKAGKRAKKSTGLPLYERDFLVGWMEMNKPTLQEISATDPTGSSGVNSHADQRGGALNDDWTKPDGTMSSDHKALLAEDDSLGDPLGDGKFDAGENNGRFTSTVTGKIPLRPGFFSNGAMGSSLTMPDDWAKLAGAMATDQDSSVNRAGAAQRWDIHDDQTLNDVHVAGTGCPNEVAAAKIDAVDNCNVGNSIGLFASNGLYSRLLGPGVPADLSQTVFGLTGPLGLGNLVIGPFDSVFPDGSLLTNGSLDKGDAPMPPARIDYKILDDPSNPTDGMGSLEEASKPDAYSRDGAAGYLTPEQKGNLYAPFYVQTPSTMLRELASVATAGALPGIESSGVSSALFTSDFPGVASLPGLDTGLAQFLYPNWAFAARNEEAMATDNGCNSQMSKKYNVTSTRQGWDQYQTPSGWQDVSVLTDEHGEAQGEYNPGTGFYKPAGAVENSNGGCDIQGIKTLGTSTIQATALYPYHDAQDLGGKDSSTVTKTVSSLFDKSLSFWSKGAGDENSVAKIVIAHAQDVDGSALSGERVCFMADHNSEGMRIFRGYTGQDNKVNVQGSTIKDPARGLDRVCGETDDNGNVAAEVFNSNGGKVNVIAEYYDEGLLRHIFVDFAQESGGQSPPPTTQTGGSSGPSVVSSVPAKGTPGTTAPTATQLKVAGVQVSAARPSATAKHVVTGRLVRPLRGKAFLRIKATGPAGQVAVRIALVNKRGSTVRTAVVRVTANRVVKVKSLKITKSVKTVRISLG